MSRRQSAQQRRRLTEREMQSVQESIARETALSQQRRLAERQRQSIQEAVARETALLQQQRLRDRQLMAEFIEVFAPEPELVPYPGAQLDLVPTPMPFVPEAPPNG